MAFRKIYDSELAARGATTLPNQPKISAAALKQEFDAPAKEVVAPIFNQLIDSLSGELAAANIGAMAPTGRTGNTVQAVMNKLSTDLATVEAGMAEAIQDAHTHDNKALLDTYTQTEADIAQAIADDHTHSNKALLDTYNQTNSDLADAVSNTHSHDNKALLDTYEQTESDIADAVNKKHSHSNKSVLDKFGESSGEPTYDGNPIGGGTGDMLASDYDANSTVKNAGGIVSYVASQAYELPTAAADTKGGIKVGTNLSVDANGVMSATDTTYSNATTEAAGLMSSSDKTKLNGIESNANNYSLPTASTSTLGGVKVDGTTVTIDGNGVISSTASGTVNDAYKSVKVGSTTVTASGEDTLELVAGSNVTLTPDASLKKVTISAAGGGGSTGDMLAADYDDDYAVKTAGGISDYVSSQISGKADKVTSATDGNFAGLNSSGNLTDSGKKASDFMASNAGIGDLSNVTITSAATDDVLKYDGSKWVNGQGSGGTTVVANPSGTATDTLTKLQVGSTIYSVEGGGTTNVQIPSVVGDSFTYDGTAQGAAITGLDTTHCTVVGGTGTTVTTSGDTTYVKATNAGSYSFSVELNDTSSMVWSDLTTADKSYSFTIAKASQTISASPSTVSLDANTQTASVTVSGASTTLSATSSDTGIATVSGTSSPVTITAVANGSATISIQAQADSNYEASNTVTVAASVNVVTIYGFHVNSSESDPSTAVTYLEDAVGKTPAAMNFGTGQFNYGSWENAFFMPRPCMLKYDGTVDYYLSPTDYTKKADGVTASGVANTSYNGNAMMEWGQNGKKIWYKIVPDTNDDTSYSVYISDYKVDNDYHAWSFVNNQGDLVEHFYTPIYNSSNISSKLRSISGQAISKTFTFTNGRTYAKANNPSTDVLWDVECYADRILINFLLVLIGKSLDTQSVFGKGITTSGSETTNNAFRTGVHNDKGLFYGTNDGTASTTSNAVKVFGMENWWGLQFRRLNGYILSNGVQKIKLTHGTQDGSTATDYNETGADYLTISDATLSGSAEYISKMKATSDGILVPTTASGSSSTYYCDVVAWATNMDAIVMVGGASGDTDKCGAFNTILNHNASQAHWYHGMTICCKPLAS